MIIRPILIAAALLAAAPALADDAAPAPASSLTASEASKASYLVTSNGQTSTINRVIPGPNDSVAGVSVIYGDSIYVIPGATVSAGDKKNRLKTSLSSKDVRALRAAN